MLTEADAAFIYDNLKPIEREELDLQGQGRDHVIGWSRHRHAFVVRVEGVPVATMGAREPDLNSPNLYLWMVGTPQQRRHMVEGTRLARVWMARMRDEFPGYHMLGEVLERYAMSVRWLETIGFRRTGSRYLLNGETFVIMEWK